MDAEKQDLELEVEGQIRLSRALASFASLAAVLAFFAAFTAAMTWAPPGVFVVILAPLLSVLGATVSIVLSVRAWRLAGGSRAHVTPSFLVSFVLLCVWLVLLTGALADAFD